MAKIDLLDNDEIAAKIAAGIDYAYKNPITLRDILDGSALKTFGPSCPNFMEIGGVDIRFTIEEHHGVWWKHLSTHIPFICGETIDPIRLLIWAKRHFDYKLDGNFQMVVDRVGGCDVCKATHLLEKV